jgi:hypothetical protein
MSSGDGKSDDAGGPSWVGYRLIERTECMRRTSFLALITATYSAALLIAIAIHGLHPLVWLSQFSWRTDDAVQAFGRQLTQPVIGHHHFGDWQSHLRWAEEPNPYLIDGGGLHATLPPVLLPLRLLDPLPLLASWLIVASVSATVTFVATWLLMDKYSARYRVLAWTACFGLSAGLLSSLDRGSLTALAAGLVALWLWASIRSNWYLAAAFLALAVCVKPYLVLLLLWPLLRGQWRTVVATGAFVGVASLLTLSVLPGSLSALPAILRGYGHPSGQLSASTQLTDGLLYTHGMASLLIHPVLLLTHDPWLTQRWLAHMPVAVILTPGLCWLALVAYATARRLVSAPLLLCLNLSLGQLVLPGSQAYTAAFAGSACVLLLITEGPPAEVVARRAIQAAVILTIVPIPVSFGGPHTYSPVPISAFLSPLAWLIAGTVCIVVGNSLKRSPHEPTTQTADPDAHDLAHDASERT